MPKELARASIFNATFILIVALKITRNMYQVPKPHKNTSKQVIDTVQIIILITKDHFDWFINFKGSFKDFFRKLRIISEKN